MRDAGQELLAQPDRAQVVAEGVGVDRGPVVGRLPGLPEPEAEPVVATAGVGGEDEEGAAEIQQVAFEVLGAALVQDAQEQPAQRRVGLLELVEQHDALGQVPDAAEEPGLTAGIADVTRRGAE